MANEALPTAKPWWQSKTILVNLLALLSMAVPAVREWVEKNPVEPVAAFVALGVILRFVTSGKIAVFGEDDDSSGNGFSSGVGASGGKAGGSGGSNAADYRESRRTRGVPWLVVSACALAFLFLPACTVGVDSAGGWSVRPDPKTIDAGLKYLIRHEEDEDGSKAGLTQWEYYDPATGEKIKPEDYAAWGITASPAE